MKEIVGLDYLLEKIDGYTLDTLPHSMILVGKAGAGKHVVSEYIGSKFNLNILDITEELSEELIYNIYRNPLPRLYLVDLRKITDKEQNILLKLFEEPSDNAFVILLANNQFNILPTILNRGMIFTIINYSKKDLEDFCNANNLKIDLKYIGDVLETPGDLLKVDSLNVNMEDITVLVDKIIHKLNIASYANTMTIINKLNFKDEYDKIDVDFFLRLLYNNSVKEYLNGDVQVLKLINIISENIKKLKDNRLNKKLLVSHMLSQMWLEVRK